MPIDQIYQNGEHYDLLFPESHATPHFWLACGRDYGDPILELACGTGRLAIPLAQQGARVTGIDLSVSMLAAAQRKAAAANVTLDLHLADMRDFDLGDRFALVLLANNALCHLHTVADFEACMAAVRRHLQPEGRFVIEVFVPNLQLLLTPPEERQLFALYDDPAGAGPILVTYSSWYDSATQIKHNTTYYQFPNHSDKVTGTLPMRMYFPQELDALLLYNGFAIEDKFGDAERHPFDATSTMQIFVLKAA
jgi:SAM-dependent methyltransferase